MLHTNTSVKASFPAKTSISKPNSIGLALVPPSGTAQGTTSSSRFEFLVIAARRCSSFFAEAAVLVLVFGILDVCVLRNRLDARWVLGALAISAGLLAASILMDFSAHRWIKAHP